MSKQGLLSRMAAVVVLGAALAAAAPGDDPLVAADVVRFLRAGISEHTILAELRERGFGEPLDAAAEATLREAGASETLIVAVRRTAPPPLAAPVAVPATPPRGAAPPPPAAGTGRAPTFAATARSVRVPVSVLDKSGQPVLGLRGADFTIAEDGRRQELTYFSGERRPLRIALALDVSTSMSTKMREVSAALQHFIDLLEPADEILVLTFSSDLHIEQDFTSDRDLLERVFSRLQPASGTALFDAAIEAIRRVAPGPAESKAVVLVTDGMDTASQSSFDELRELARRSEVPVFSLGIGSDTTFRRTFDPIGGIRIPGRGPGRGPGGGWPGGGGGWPGGGGGGWPGGGSGGGRRGPAVPPNEADFDARPLLDLAEDTGGRAAILKGLERDRGGRTDRLQEAVESIAVTLRHRYLVGYEPSSGKPGWRKIKVEVDRSPVSVQARKGYYAEG